MTGEHEVRLQYRRGIWCVIVWWHGRQIRTAAFRTFPWILIERIVERETIIRVLEAVE